MSGLLALLDDIALIAKLAAATLDDAATQAVQAGTKAAGVVIDDAAVTPRYVTGLAAKRELPIIGRIAAGSLKNKLLFLLPAALLLTEFMPGAITPLLMLGGFYLCFEGYEKVHHMFSGHDAGHDTPEAASIDPKTLEDQRVAGAIRTDFILSAEIMAIALASITAPDLVTRATVLAVVGLFITVAVYGAVALIVKADDLGVYLAKRGGLISAPFGRALVNGMPPFLKLLSFIGMIAMLWVGGGILIHGLAAYGISGPEHLLHDISAAAGAALPIAGDARVACDRTRFGHRRARGRRFDGRRRMDCGQPVQEDRRTITFIATLTLCLSGLMHEKCIAAPNRAASFFAGR